MLTSSQTVSQRCGAQPQSSAALWLGNLWSASVPSPAEALITASQDEVNQKYEPEGACIIVIRSGSHIQLPTGPTAVVCVKQV